MFRDRFIIMAKKCIAKFRTSFQSLNIKKGRNNSLIKSQRFYNILIYIIYYWGVFPCNVATFTPLMDHQRKHLIFLFRYLHSLRFFSNEDEMGWVAPIFFLFLFDNFRPYDLFLILKWIGLLLFFLEILLGKLLHHPFSLPLWGLEI